MSQDSPSSGIEVRGLPAWLREHRYTLLLATGIGVAVWLAIAALRETGSPFFLLEARARDFFIRRLPPEGPGKSPCVIVRIAETDIQRWQQYPISDRLMAELLEKLLSMNPRAVAIDIYRDVRTPDLRDDPAAATQPAKAIADRDREKLAACLNDSRVFSCFLNVRGPNRVSPPPELRGKPGRYGYTDLPIDSDGVVRRYWLFADDAETGDESVGALGLRLARRYAIAEQRERDKADGLVRPPDDRGPVLTRFDELTSVPVPPTAGAYVRRALGESDLLGYPTLLDFRGPREFETYTVSQVLDGQVPPDRFAGRAVLIGVNTPSVKDIAATPLDDLTPGVAIHAHAADQLLALAIGAGGRVAPWWWPDGVEQLWILGWSVIGAAAGYFTRSIIRSVSAAGLAVAAIVAAGVVAERFGGWIPVIPAAAAVLFSSSIVNSLITQIERRDRHAWERLSETLLSPEVSREMWRSRQQLFDHGRIRPQKMIATVLFCDLKGFSGFAQTVESDVLIGWLNEFFDPMSRTVRECGGVVNKYAGDQIMALFGPPIARATEAQFRQDALNAVRCAVMMRQSLEKMNRRWAEINSHVEHGQSNEPRRPVVKMRVGINTGPLVAGSLGGSERLEYTVIGHTVNSASRLESVEKDRMDPAIAPAGCRILIGPRTESYVRELFVLEQFGQTELSGITGKVAVYAVLGSL